MWRKRKHKKSSYVDAIEELIVRPLEVDLPSLQLAHAICGIPTDGRRVRSSIFVNCQGNKRVSRMYPRRGLRCDHKREGKRSEKGRKGPHGFVK